MKQKEFAITAAEILKSDENVIGLAVGGSWITERLDTYADLDLIVVTREKIAGNSDLMLDFAAGLGDMISGFTGEHVGEPRLLICLYDHPLLHVDIKFLQLSEFDQRIENPAILLDKTGKLQKVLKQTVAQFPYPDYQWIEDRFWTWIHYSLLKIGRGEYLEAVESLSFMRTTVLGPLALIKQGYEPRGVRKVETLLDKADLDKLLQTISTYNRASLLKCLKNGVLYYRQLRDELFTDKVKLQNRAEETVMIYFKEIEAMDC